MFGYENNSVLVKKHPEKTVKNNIKKIKFWKFRKPFGKKNKKKFANNFFKCGLIFTLYNR